MHNGIKFDLSEKKILGLSLDLVEYNQEQIYEYF